LVPLVSKPVSLSSCIALSALFFFSLFPGRGSASSHATESFLLSNGLRVVVKRDGSSHLTALQLWVEAGAADERPEEAGLAHLLEHILLRGRSDRGTGKLTAEIEGLGGRINALTTHDHTVYHLVLPTAHLKEGLRVLAEMIRLPTLDEPELQREIQVVLEEWKQDQDSPRTFVRRDLFQSAYRLLPYGRPVIGAPETIKAITPEALSRFYQRWYTAPNMILVAVGDFDARRIKENMGEFFASLPEYTSALHHRPLELQQDQPRVNVLKAPVRQAHLTIGFPMVKATDAEAPALDLLAFILGRGESSRLAQRVKVAAGLAHSISASTFTPREPGLFLVEAQLEADKTMGALGAILKEIYRLREEPVDPIELSRAHVNFLRAFVQNRETVQGQANQIGRFQSLYGNPDYEEIYLENLRRLGPEDLKRIARAFFKTDALSLSLAIPEETARLPVADEIAGLSRSLESFSGAPAAKREAGVLRETLENGLRIVIQEDRRLPVFTMRASVVGGLLLEDETNNGIHNFIAAMLTQGTPQLTSSSLVQEVEQLGGSLNGSADHHALSLTGTFPSERSERGLDIFLDALLHPAFPEAQLEKKRQEILTRIDTREEQVQAQAFRFFYQTLFRNHPYRLDPLGEREQVLRLSRDELIGHYQRLISPDRVILTIVGDVDGQDLLRRLQSKLSSLGRRDSAFSLPSAEERITEIRVAKKTTKTKQSHLILGFPAPAKGQAGYFTMRVLQAILSQFGGRLFVELRDKQGLAYSVGAFSLDAPLQGGFGIYAATDPTSVEKMREEMLREIHRLREEEVQAHELERAKNVLMGNYLIARQTNESKAAETALNELFGLGADYGQRYREGIEAVTAEDVLKFARQYLSTDRYALAIVGP